MHGAPSPKQLVHITIKQVSRHGQRHEIQYADYTIVVLKEDTWCTIVSLDPRPFQKGLGPDYTIITFHLAR